MDRVGLSPAGASVWLVLLGLLVLYLAALTIWSHVNGMRSLGPEARELEQEERVRFRRTWVRRISRLYGIGWLVFAYGTLSIGVIELGFGFVTSRVPLFVVWLLSPGGVWALAYAYWSYWARAGVPTEY